MCRNLTECGLRTCDTMFLRRSARLGYRANSTATFASICDDADYQLFERITSNSQYLLHPLLPPEREQHYSLRERSHHYQLPERTTQLKDKNFITRMLYRDWLLHSPHHASILCKLDSVLSVILLKFYVCMYVSWSLITMVHSCCSLSTRLQTMPIYHSGRCVFPVSTGQPHTYRFLPRSTSIRSSHHLTIHQRIISSKKLVIHAGFDRSKTNAVVAYRLQAQTN